MSFIAKYIDGVRALQFFQLFRFLTLLSVGVVLSKTNIGISQIGTYETFLLISGAICFFWLGGMLQAFLVDERNKSNSKQKSLAFFNVSLIISILGIVAAGIVWLLQSEIALLVGFAGGRIPYLRILMLFIIVSSPANLVEYIYLLKNKPYRIIVYGVTACTAQLLLTILPVIFTDDLGYGLYGLVFANVLKCIWLAVLVFKYSEIKISFKYLKNFLSLSVPLIVSVLLVKGIQYVDFFLVSYKFDEATFAQFRYGAKEFPFILLALTALAEAMTPLFAQNANIDKTLEKTKTENKRLMHILFPCAMICVIVSKYVYPFVFNQDFAMSAIIFNVYCFASVFRFMIPNSILIGKKQTQQILAASGINLTINILLGILLMNLLGMFGIAIAYAVGNFVEKIILVSVVKTQFGISLNRYLDVKTFVYYSILLLLCVIVGSIS